jgi:hypothetical protein
MKGIYGPMTGEWKIHNNKIFRPFYCSPNKIVVMRMGIGEGKRRHA